MLNRVAAVIALFGALTGCSRAAYVEAQAQDITAASMRPASSKPTVMQMYLMHVISFPVGWSVPPYPGLGVNPTYAAMGENGSVGIILEQSFLRYRSPDCTRGNPSDAYCAPGPGEFPAQRILILRSDGTETFLHAAEAFGVKGYRFEGDRVACQRDTFQCPFITGIALARDGTPFATLSDTITGAFTGQRHVVLVWNGAWHVVPKGNPFGDPNTPNTPTNLSIAAADSAVGYAYNGDFADWHPPEGWNGLGAVNFGLQTILLGENYVVTAMRGAYAAGADNDSGSAVLWHCPQSSKGAHSCESTELGPGIVSGVDSRGEAVGDDNADRPEIYLFQFYGRPVLWRDGKPLRLSDANGMAYAISESGLIVGTLDKPVRAFVAYARGRQPHVTELDSVVGNRGQFHVAAALGVSNDGRILVLVQPANGRYPAEHRQLALLFPQHGTRGN